MHNDQDQAQFAVGDHVWWVSQAQGNTRTKHGVILAVVAPYETSRQAITRVGSAHTLSNPDMPRNTVSYLVLAQKTGIRGARTKLYWPLVRNLEHDDKTHTREILLDVRTEARDAHNYLIETYPEFTALSPAAQNALRVALEQMGSRFQ